MSIFRSTFFLIFVICILPGECDVIYRQAGGEVSMKCNVPPNSNVEWKLNDILIIYVDGKRGTKRKGSSHVYKKASTFEDTLKISKLETGDSGVYTCTQTGKKYTVHVISVSVTPDTRLFQSSDAELCCNIGDAKDEVQWLKPNGQRHNEKKQVIKLKSVTSDDEGQWTCLVQDLKINITLTVRGLQTNDVKAHQGDAIVLPCSLPWVTSKRVQGGKWKADHRSKVSFPTLQSTNGILQWEGQNSSEVTFTSGQLSTNYDITLLNVQPSDEGRYVCTVEFEDRTSLTASTMLTIVPDPSGGKVRHTEKGQKPESEIPWTKDVFGVQLWVWIAVGASSVVLIGLIILAVVVHQRNKRIKKRVRKLKSTRQPLTAKDYCQCNRSEREVEFRKQMRPLPVPRQQRNEYHSPKPYN